MRAVSDFNRSIHEMGLDPDAFVFHAGPLIRREKGYEFFTRNHRGKIYNRMMTFARRIDFKWHCLCVDKKYINSSLQIVGRLQLQLADLICTLYLVSTKIKSGERLTDSEYKFFGGPSAFRRAEAKFLAAHAI